MHDRYTGAITSLEFSDDGTWVYNKFTITLLAVRNDVEDYDYCYFYRHLYTCGSDGNIFSYVINFIEPLLTTTDVPQLEELPVSY